MMKTCFNTLLAATLFVSAPAFADDTHHPAAAKGIAETTTAVPAEAQTKAAPAQKRASTGMDNMKKMQEQMEKLHAATDPKEREKLLQEHMQSMQEIMGMMHGMGADKKGGSMMHDMMERRMDMMQMMMEQMLQHQEATEGVHK